VVDDPTFGTELRRLRVGAGLSLTGLASLTHYSKGYLSRVETGSVPPNQKLAWICESALRGDGALAALARPGRRRAAGGHPGQGRKPLSGLPYDTAHFTGRDTELRDLITILCRAEGKRGSVVVCAVDGMGGVGKTALAVHAAHQLGGRFPDGCLFLDLHGYTGAVPPVAPADALDRLLRRIGVTGDQIPAHVDERAALYRDRLAGKSMIIVLDNARSAEQVRPLLPGTSDCRVLVTSRSRLTALDDACHLTLGTLPIADATTLFQSVAGAAGQAGEETIKRIVRSCGHLPLAIRIAAARYRHNSARTLEDLDERLADSRARLDELQDGERSVAAAFTVSYESLPERLRRMFVLLGCHPGTDWDSFAAAALVGTGVRAVERDLDLLLGANLVVQYCRGRYRLHDLLSAYARQTWPAEIPGQECRAAVRRLLAFYLYTADKADRLITPHRYRIPLGIEDRPAAVPVLSEYQDALTWLTGERANVMAVCRVAAEHGFDSLCWQLAYTMRGIFFLTRQWDEWIQAHALALACARRAGDRRAEAMTLSNLGLALLERGDLDDAEGALQGRSDAVQGTRRRVWRE